MSNFKFELGQTITTSTGITGKIMARSESLHCSNQYHIEYKNETGTHIQDWVFEGQIAS